MDKVEIYTDGGAEPNPGTGGWGAVMLHPATGTERELSGGALDTTNNRMEMTAAIQALESLKGPCKIDVYTDSQYLRQGITQWLPNWVKKGWKKSGGGKVKNQDLWQKLQVATERHEISWHWVKGHAGHEYNERCDALATEAIQAQKKAARGSGG